jgi:hypothetical protein
MATTFDGRVALDILFHEIRSSNVRPGMDTARFSELVDMATGTADNQINAAYAVDVTGIGASVTTVYDLIGTLLALDGTVLNFDEVVLIAVKNLSTTAANWLSVGPDATNGFGVVATNKGFWSNAADRNVLPADGGSWMVLHSKGGVPAAAGSTDELAIITQSGTSANTWRLMILGRDNP